ncbi:MAG TPA: PKD domain-containing protein, partial [Bacteroidetes bacterium]|nr:PKD domain-containing protein [Bacteroidota bacterium]
MRRIIPLFLLFFCLLTSNSLFSQLKYQEIGVNNAFLEANATDEATFLSPPPTCNAGFAYMASLCPTVSFFDQSTSGSAAVNSWQWDFGDGGSSNMQYPDHLYGANGTFLVCLTITTTDSCTSTFCDSIQIGCVLSGCDAFFSSFPSVNGCPSIDFFDYSIGNNGMVNNWAWTFGDGSTSNMQNPSHAYAANGTYLVCLSIQTTDSCTDTYCDTLNISCITPPTCNAGFQWTFGSNCPTTSFFDGSTASPGVVNSWSWTFGDGGTSNMQNPAHTYAANGTYLVCLTIATSDSCTSTFCDTLAISC